MRVRPAKPGAGLAKAAPRRLPVVRRGTDISQQHPEFTHGSQGLCRTRPARPADGVGRGSPRLPAGADLQRRQQGRSGPRDLFGLPHRAGPLPARFLRRRDRRRALPRLRARAARRSAPAPQPLQAALEGGAGGGATRWPSWRCSGPATLAGTRPAGAGRRRQAPRRRDRLMSTRGWSASVLRAIVPKDKVARVRAGRVPAGRLRRIRRAAPVARDPRRQPRPAGREGAAARERLRRAQRRRLEEGLLCRPGADRAHEVSRAGAQAADAGAHRGAGAAARARR